MRTIWISRDLYKDSDYELWRKQPKCDKYGVYFGNSDNRFFVLFASYDAKHMGLPKVLPGCLVKAKMIFKIVRKGKKNVSKKK